MKKILMSLVAMMLVLAMMVPVFAEDTVSGATSALDDAQAAYKEAKQATSLTDYEAEVNAMVAAGTLTQEQADLLLTAAKERYALSTGTCPSCGYTFTTTTAGRNGRNGKNGMKGFGRNVNTVSDDATDLEKAQAAYDSAKQTADLTEYETELNAMVAAGTLTQEQADLLLKAAKEQYALSNGTCPNCGYQFTTTTVNNGHGGRGGKGSRH